MGDIFFKRHTDLHSSTETENQVEGRLLLDVVV